MESEALGELQPKDIPRFAGARRTKAILFGAVAVGVVAVAGCSSTSSPHSSPSGAHPLEHPSSPTVSAAAVVTPAGAAAAPTPIVLPSFTAGDAAIFFGNDLLTQVPKTWADRTSDRSFATANGIPSTDQVELLLQGPDTGTGNTVPVILIVQLSPNDYQDPSQFQADTTGNPGFSAFQVLSVTPVTVGGDSGLAATVTGSASDGRGVKEWSVVVDHTPKGGEPTTYVISFVTAPGTFATEFPLAERVVGSLSWSS